MKTDTVEMFPMPKKRGRPVTGSAMTGAERQAKYREKQKQEAYGMLKVSSQHECMMLRSALLSRQQWLQEMLDVAVEFSDDALCESYREQLSACSALLDRAYGLEFFS
jgi:hypothetical protein